MSTFGQRVARQRLKLGWTQGELAAAVQVRTETINRLEHAQERLPRQRLLKALARTLGCTTDYLVGMYEEAQD